MVTSFLVDGDKYGVMYGDTYPTSYETNKSVQIHVCPGQVCPGLAGSYRYCLTSCSQCAMVSRPFSRICASGLLGILFASACQCIPKSAGNSFVHILYKCTLWKWSKLDDSYVSSFPSIDNHLPCLQQISHFWKTSQKVQIRRP